jgi:hypothetical protein
LALAPPIFREHPLGLWWFFKYTTASPKGIGLHAGSGATCQNKDTNTDKDKDKHKHKHKHNDKDNDNDNDNYNDKEDKDVTSKTNGRPSSLPSSEA